MITTKKKALWLYIYILYINTQVFLQTCQWFQKLENENGDNPAEIKRKIKWRNKIKKTSWNSRFVGMRVVSKKELEQKDLKVSFKCMNETKVRNWQHSSHLLVYWSVNKNFSFHRWISKYLLLSPMWKGEWLVGWLVK